jgi:peptidoglycan/LPS O-acetylase OafA/YrhL
MLFFKNYFHLISSRDDLRIVTAMAIALLAATCSYYLIERPSRFWLRRWLMRNPTKTAIAP